MTVTAPSRHTPRINTGWTPDRRAKHAAAIRRWKPWAKSTGPKTASGKARSAQNAYKHGGRATAQRLLDQSVAAQNACLQVARQIACLQKINPANKLLAGLLARLYARFHTLDRIFHVRLYQHTRYERLCKNLAFSDGIRQKVNANDNG